MRRHHLPPVFVALFTGLFHIASPRTASAAPPTITIVSPTPGALVDDQVSVTVDIQSVYQITAVKAQTAFGSANLSNAGTTWTGTVPLKGAGWGNQNITFTATYSLNQQVTAQVTALHDLKPVLTLGAPIDGAVTTGALPIDAACSDDGPAPCTIEVLYRGQSIASGPSPFHKTVSIASFAPSSFLNTATRDFKVRAKDSSGQATDSSAEVWMLPPQPGRVEVEQAPQGKIVDYNEGWLLTATQDVPNDRHLYSRAAKMDVFSGWSKYDWYLTPTGALIQNRTYDAPGPLNLDYRRVYEWKAGALTDWDEWPDRLVVRGKYAAFQKPCRLVNDQYLPCPLMRRDLLTGADTIVAQRPFDAYEPQSLSPLEITPAGDVYFHYKVAYGYAQVVTQRSVAQTGMVESYTGSYDLWCYDTPVRVSADDHLAALLCNDGTADARLYIRDLATSQIIKISVPDWPYYWQPSVVNGWLAYESKQGGVVQVWRRYANGGQEQVSAFPGDSHLISLGPNGEVTFSHGDEVWTGVPGAAPVPGAPYRFINGKAYFAAGRSLFLENALTGGSSTSSGAGGTGGAGGAGGAGGTSTSGAGGTGVTSTSGAGSVGASGSTGASTGASTSTGSTSSGSTSGGGSSGGCSVSGERGASPRLEGLGLLGLAALFARRRGRRGRRGDRPFPRGPRDQALRLTQ